MVIYLEFVTVGGYKLFSEEIDTLITETINLWSLYFFLHDDSSSFTFLTSPWLSNFFELYFHSSSWILVFLIIINFD